MTGGNANDARAYGEGPGPNPKSGSLDRLGDPGEKSDPSEAGTADGRTSFEDDSVAGRWEWAQEAEEMAQNAVMTKAGGR